MAQAKTKHEKDPAKCLGTIRSGKRKGEQCGHEKGWGTSHVGRGYCRYHGGNSPNHLRADEKEVVREIVNQLNVPKGIEPIDALLQELARTNGMVHWLGSKVATLEEQTKGGLGGSQMVGPVGGAAGGIPEWKQSVWIAMWQEERTHLSKVAKLCLDAGIDERRVKIAEEQGQMLASVVTAVLTKLGIDLEAAKTRKAIREGFMLVEGTGTELVPA